jgi:hypothetical protein
LIISVLSAWASHASIASFELASRAIARKKRVREVANISWRGVALQTLIYINADAPRCAPDTPVGGGDLEYIMCSHENCAAGHSEGEQNLVLHPGRHCLSSSSHLSS